MMHFFFFFFSFLYLFVFDIMLLELKGKTIIQKDIGNLLASLYSGIGYLKFFEISGFGLKWRKEKKNFIPLH